MNKNQNPYKILSRNPNNGTRSKEGTRKKSKPLIWGWLWQQLQGPSSCPSWPWPSKCTQNGPSQSPHPSHTAPRTASKTRNFCPNQSHTHPLQGWRPHWASRYHTSWQEKPWCASPGKGAGTGAWRCEAVSNSRCSSCQQQASSWRGLEEGLGCRMGTLTTWVSWGSSRACSQTLLRDQIDESVKLHPRRGRVEGN